MPGCDTERARVGERGGARFEPGVGETIIRRLVGDLKRYGMMLLLAVQVDNSSRKDYKKQRRDASLLAMMGREPRLIFGYVRFISLALW